MRILFLECAFLGYCQQKAIPVPAVHLWNRLAQETHTVLLAFTNINSQSSESVWGYSTFPDLFEVLWLLLGESIVGVANRRFLTTDCSYVLNVCECKKDDVFLVLCRFMFHPLTKLWTPLTCSTGGLGTRWSICVVPHSQLPNLQYCKQTITVLRTTPHSAASDLSLQVIRSWEGSGDKAA